MFGCRSEPSPPVSACSKAKDYVDWTCNKIEKSVSVMGDPEQHGFTIWIATRYAFWTQWASWGCRGHSAEGLVGRRRQEEMRTKTKKKEDDADKKRVG